MPEEREIIKIKESVSKLERQNRRLTWGFRLLLALWVATFTASAVIRQARAEMDNAQAGLNVTQNSVLRVRGLVVVDENGTERVQIGAPLPDPLTLGKRSKRVGAISGILLMDDDGNERSGYVTSDATGEVFLTLDNVGGQTAMFYANPHTGSQLYVRDIDNGNFLELNATGKNPGLTIVRQGKTVFKVPEAGSGK
jgi:hypothetical protein